MARSKLKTQSLADNASTNVTAKASVYLSSDQSVDTSTATTIELDTEFYDVGGDFNTGTYQFTCPVDGFYLVTGSIIWTAPVDAKRYEVAIKINSANQANNLVNSSGTVNVTSAVTQVIELSATDTIELVGWHDSGVNKDARGLFLYTYMTVHLLST